MKTAALAALVVLLLVVIVWLDRPDYACTDDPGDDIPACEHPTIEPSRSPVWVPVPNAEYCRSIGGSPDGPDGHVVCAVQR